MPSPTRDPAPLTPAMRSLMARIERAGRPPFNQQGVAEARRSYEAAAEILDLPRRPLARVEDTTLPGGDGRPRPVRLYAPQARDDAAAPLPALLYLHGGGFTIGSLETHDSLCRQIAHRGGCAVVALDYRRAPEARFPAAVDDTWAALDALHAQAGTLGLDPGRLAIGGDSAGGTLATVGALQARDRGLALRLQVLITPGTAARTDSDSHHRYARGHLLDRDDIAWFFDQYIEPAQRTDWRFAPLEAEVLEGVAPALVVLAECDPLVDEGLAYADRLRAAGVAVELELLRGVTHDFIKLGRAIPEADAAQAAIGAALRRAFAAG